MKFLNDVKKANNSLLELKKLGFVITNEDLPLEVGETKYDPDAETLVTRITENDVLRHGQELLAQVRNQTGATIPKGRAVYVTGGIANSPITLVALANNTVPIEARRVIGLTTTDIPNNSFGKVVTSGVVQDLTLPSSEWEVGDCVYLTTNGEYVNTPPAKGTIVVRIGTVIRVGNNTGAIFLFARLNPFLSMLSDVDISDPQNNEVLTYENGLWKNKTLETIDTFDASNVTYDGSEFEMLQDNVQDALDQIFFMFKALTLEYDGGLSGSFYNETQGVNGGDSDIPLTGIKQINGGES